ncbi:MAG: hypothetical protein ACWIPJ_09970, partial [Polaribacter sp.]
MNKLLPFLLLFFALNIFSQKEANFWYFGENAGLDFNSGKPIAITDGKLHTEEGCSTISNKDGKLLFYSDGTILYNKKHEIMTFTDGTLANNLGGNSSSTQSALFVPNPVKDNVYYLFTVGTNITGNIGLSNPGFSFYTITIDPTVNNGLGSITSGPINLAGSNSKKWSEKVTAVQGDCNSIWVLSAVGNKIHSYKITGAGVDLPNSKQWTTNYTLQDKRGYLKVSPDGKKIAMADFTRYQILLKNGRYQNLLGNGRLVLFDFNDQTGEVSSNATILTTPSTDGVPYGVEFSQQSNKLYVSTYDRQNKVFQFDLTKPNIASTKSLIHSQDGYRSALQLGPDGKIYNSIPYKSSLDVIENPNAKPTNVIYKEAVVNLETGIAVEGLPPFIQSFFSPVNIVSSLDNTLIVNQNKQEICLDDSLQIEPEIKEPAGVTFQYFWTKEGDPSVDIRTRNFTINNTNYGSGIYNLKVITINNCGKQKKYNSSIEIEFNAIPTINNINVYEQCDFDNNPNDYKTNFNLTTRESEIYTGSDTVDIAFFETTDTSFLSPLTKNNYVNSVATSPANGNHKLIVKVTNKNTGCYST